MSTTIVGVGRYLPEKIVTNNDLAQSLDTSDEWILEHTGIRRRRIAASDQACSDLAYEAADQAIKNAGLTPADIELIIVATTTADYPNFPSTACILQQRLGCGPCPAFDLMAACSGFVYAFNVAHNFLKSGQYRTALVVGSELLSKLIDWQDRSTAVLFGDGAGAVVVQNQQGYGEIDSLLYANGNLAEVLSVRAGGSRAPFADCKDPRDFYVQMNGRKVYNFAVESMQQIIRCLLERNGYKWQDLRYIVPHQANLRIIQAVAKREQIPLEKFYINIENYANTSAATIPIALAEMLEENVLQNGDLLILVGFGAGATWAGTLLRWGQTSPMKG